MILISLFDTNRLFGFDWDIMIIIKKLQLQVIIIETNDLLLQGINYSYLKLIIFKQIYLAHLLNPKM